MSEGTVQGKQEDTLSMYERFFDQGHFYELSKAVTEANQRRESEHREAMEPLKQQHQEVVKLQKLQHRVLMEFVKMCLVKMAAADRRHLDVFESSANAKAHLDEQHN